MGTKIADLEIGGQKLRNF